MDTIAPKGWIAWRGIKLFGVYILSLWRLPKDN